MYAYYIDYAMESEGDKEREHTGVGVPTAILGVAEHLRRIKLIHNSALTTK